MTTNSVSDELSQTIIRLIAERKPQNTRQLVNLIKTKIQLREEEIFAALMRLQNQGRIRLEDPPSLIAPKMTEFVKKKPSHWYWATLSITIISAIVVLAIPEELTPFNLLRIPFGLLFILWLPGYAFMKAFFTHKNQKEPLKGIDEIERIAVSIGVSLAIVPIVGLVLYYTQLGLNMTSVVLSLLSITVFLASIALQKEKK